MNINSPILMLIVSCFFCSIATSQSNYRSGLLPSVNLNKEIAKDWQLNFKIESRQLLKERSLGNITPYEYLHTDFAFVVSNKVGFNSKIGGGYLSRLKDNVFIHRLIQQYTYVEKYASFRLAHRFSTDQTFVKGAPTEYRFRYRATLEIPLNGKSIDPKEFYLKFNNEYLNAFEAREYDLEIRFSPLLGLKLNEGNKLELGLDYRLDSFLENQTKNHFWTSINWYLKL